MEKSKKTFSLKYDVEISEVAEKFLEKIPKRDRSRIIKKIDGLVENSMPLGSIKLHGYTTLYRIRSGDYRVIYSIKKDLLIILVVEIGHRKEIYR
ncbi:MAG: type II toxin-antitoxin system RelE/ParE family toxin [Candidatus Rhabdochlamydia sp.]